MRRKLKIIRKTLASTLNKPTGSLRCLATALATSGKIQLRIFLPEYFYNIGTGKDITIKELAETIQSVTGHQGNIVWDTSKPDGTPRKLMDVSKMREIGWKYSTELEDGIKKTYQWFLENIDAIKEIKL